MAKVYVACKFRPDDNRAYTYTWEGEPLKVGDFVKVADRSGDGWKRLSVVAISDEAPPFACKPILGLYNPDLETIPAPLKTAELDSPVDPHDPLNDFKLPF